MKRATPNTSIWLLLLTALLLGLTVVATAPAKPAAAAPPKQEPAEKPSAVRGAALWTDNCVPCHGPTGLGDGPTAASLQFPPANFADPELAKARIPAEMFATIKDGRMDKLMPPWSARLSETEIWDVWAYVENLSTSQPELETAGAVYTQNCAQCHGENGVGNGGDMSRPATLINASLQTLFDELRPAQGNHASLSALSDEALWQSLLAIRNFSRELPKFDGILRGKVINGTTGEIIANQEVILHALSANGDTLQTYAATSAEDGSFSFEKLNRDHALAYGLEGKYLDIGYFSPEPTVFFPEAQETTLDLTVYETTTDPAAVSQSNFHRIMSFNTDWISLADVYIFSNSGDRAYIGRPGADGLPETIKVALPLEATNISFRSGAVRPASGSGAYVDGQSIPPGEGVYTLFVTYDIPINGSAVTLENPLYYNVLAVNILATDQGETITGPQLTLMGVESIQGNNYMRLAGANFKANDTFVMEISRLDQIEVAIEDPANGGPATAAAADAGFNQNILLWSILGLGLVMVAFSLIYTGRKQVETVPAATPAHEKTRLLVLLTELEAQYRAGKIDESVYRRLRLKYRASLRQIQAQTHD